MQKRKVTIRDVAERAGVSKVTVSYVLNDRQSAVKISEETKQRIWAAVEELGYHPNAVARALARKRTDTIAIVLQFPAVFRGWSGFTNELMHGASDKAIQLGYDLILHTKAQSSIMGELQAITDGRADGALLLRDYDDPLPGMLAERGFPYMLFFTRSPRRDTYWVDCDNFLGGRLATEHLLRLGHTKILHLTGSPASASVVDRLAGYRDTLRANDIPVRQEWIVQVNHPGDDFTSFTRLMQSADRPTAIFAWSDDVAIRAMSICREINLRVPQDVAIIGYDSTGICEHTNPPLTSVRQPIYEMACSAMQTLVDLIEGNDPPERHTIYAPALDIRGSCGAKQISKE